MYVCTYDVRTYDAGTYVPAYRASVRRYVCMSVCMSVCLSVCMSVCLPVCLYANVCMYVCNVCMYVCIYVSMYLCIYVCMYVCSMHTCMHVWMSVCMFILLYICGMGPDQYTAAVLHNHGFIHLTFTPSLESLCKQALGENIENAVYRQGIQMYEDVDVYTLVGAGLFIWHVLLGR
jgi:hypothetical protein